MDTQGTGTDALRFSTRHVPPVERLSAWNNEFGRSLSRRLLVPTRSADAHHHIEMTGHVLGADAHARVGGSVIDMMVTGGGTARRTPELLRDGNDDIVLHIQSAGRRLVSQRGRDATVEAGGAVVTSNADTSTIVLPGPARFVCVAAPRKLMMVLAPGVEEALVRPLPPSAGVLRLLTKYLSVLDDDETLRAPGLRCAVATHIYDLFALAIGAARDAAHIAVRRGVRAARLHAVKADIVEHLSHGDVSAEAIAWRQGVTPRYVHKLFELEGTTLSRFRLGQRLARVHGMLVGGHQNELTISEMAYRAGFNDLSTFNREFRRHFGASPSELRSESASGSAGGST
jgi:AraC-like DNA-binding protein